jgi:hypothetical protein
MSAKFYTLLTEIGAAKLASAAALGVPLKITQMAVGDGGGVLPTPSAQQTALVSEKRRASLNMLYIDPQNSSQIIAEQVIPETEGGWWIREVGLFDDTGALIAVGNCPESYKPQLAEGSGRTQTVRMVLITSSTENITLKIDPAVVLATRKYVDDKVLELKVYVDDLMAKHLAAADPHTQYATKASPTFTGMPKAPTAAAGSNSTQLATTAFVQLAIAALVDSSPGALDTLNELAKALGNDPNFATTMTNALAGKMDKSANGADIADIAAFLSNLGMSDYIQGAIGNTTQWDLWKYLGLVDALNSKQPVDAVLSSLAALATAENKLPYFSDVDEMDLTDLTAFARGLLGKASAAAAKAHLGVGSAGARNVGIGFSAGGSEIPDMTFFGGLKGAAGYQYCPTGVLIQWGTVGLNSAPSGTVIGKFPVAFPSAGQQIIVTHDNPLASTLAFGAASIIDSSSFRVNAIAIDANTFTMVPGHALTLRWIAIGS